MTKLWKKGTRELKADEYSLSSAWRASTPLSQKCAGFALNLLIAAGLPRCSAGLVRELGVRRADRRGSGLLVEGLQ